MTVVSSLEMKQHCFITNHSASRQNLQTCHFDTCQMSGATVSATSCEVRGHVATQQRFKCAHLHAGFTTAICLRHGCLAKSGSKLALTTSFCCHLHYQECKDVHYPTRQYVLTHMGFTHIHNITFTFTTYSGRLWPRASWPKDGGDFSNSLNPW